MFLKVMKAVLDMSAAVLPYMYTGPQSIPSRRSAVPWLLPCLHVRDISVSDLKFKS